MAFALKNTQGCAEIASILNRCTKNYYVYQDPVTGEWERLPYDLKSAFATDRGFNGSVGCCQASADFDSAVR